MSKKATEAHISRWERRKELTVNACGKQLGDCRGQHHNADCGLLGDLVKHMPEFCPESRRVLCGFLKDKLAHLLFVKSVHWGAENSKMSVHFLSLRVNENLLPSELDESDVWSGRRDLDMSPG